MSERKVTRRGGEGGVVGKLRLRVKGKKTEGVRKRYEEIWRGGVKWFL